MEVRQLINNGSLIIIRNSDEDVLSIQGKLPDGRYGYWIDLEHPFTEIELNDMKLLDKHLQDLAERVDIEMHRNT